MDNVVRGRTDTDIASWRQRPGRLTTGGAQNNADPRLTTGSPGDRPFFPSRPLEKDLRDPGGDETEEYRSECGRCTRTTRPYFGAK